MKPPFFLLDTDREKSNQNASIKLSRRKRTDIFKEFQNLSLYISIMFQFFAEKYKFVTRFGVRICPIGGLGSPIKGLYNRTEGIFLCERRKFCVENSPNSIHFFSDERASAPRQKGDSPSSCSLWRYPCFYPKMYGKN